MQEVNTAAVTHQEVMIPALDNVRTRKLASRFSTRSVAIRLFLTCWVIYGLHFATNTVREIYPALSLGDHLSFEVSEYTGLHPDIFAIPGGGVFINNNPGASIVGAIPYVLTRPAIDRVVEHVKQSRAASTQNEPAAAYDSPYPMAREFYRQARERGYDVKFGLASGAIQALAMAPLSALSAVVMFYIFIGLKVPTRTALLLTLLYAFATPVFYRTAQLNQNLLVGHCALFAFALMWRPWDEPSGRKPNYLLAGLLSGWAVVLDYSGVVVPIVMGLYAIARRAKLPSENRSPLDIWHFVAGVAACGVVLAAYQWVNFGHPLYPAQRYMPPTEFSVYGYNGMDRPQLDLLWTTAFGMRFGLFTSAPLLLLALWVPGWLDRRKRLVGNLETWCIVVFTVAFFLFCSANHFGRLQFNSGVRYIVPVVPFLFFPAASVLLRLPKVVAVLFGIVGTYWSWCLAMYRDVEQGLGVLEPIRRITFEGFRLPWLQTLHRMGYVSEGASALPLLLVCVAIVWAFWNVGKQKKYSGTEVIQS